jgi:DNA-binding CsgD family transcriptional regulator
VEPLLAAGTTPALGAQLAICHAQLALGSGDAARGRDHAETALSLAREHRLPEAECAALQLLGRFERRSSLELAEERFRQALATAEAADLPPWRLRATHEIGTIALLDRSAVTTLLQAQALAESLGAMATAAILDVEIAAGYAGLHDPEAEARHGSQAVRRGTRLGLGLVVAYGSLHVGGASAVSGDRERIASARSAATGAAPGSRDVEGMLVGACDLMAALLDDDTQAALLAAERCARLLRDSAGAPPAHFRALWPLLLACTRGPEARAAVREIERAGVAVNRAGRATLAMARAVLAGRTDPERAALLAVEADGELVHVPLWRHLARRLAAEAAAADGWHLPEGWMAETEEWLRGHGYPAVADACRALRDGPSSAVPPAWSRFGITGREAQVLAMVIEGCSNREIASRLYLSVRTVEKHVESLLRTTGTRSRTQLARATATT